MELFYKYFDEDIIITGTNRYAAENAPILHSKPWFSTSKKLILIISRLTEEPEQKDSWSNNQCEIDFFCKNIIIQTALPIKEKLAREQQRHI